MVLGDGTGVVGHKPPMGAAAPGGLGAGLVVELCTGILCRGTVTVAGMATAWAAQTGTVGVGASALGSVCIPGVLV